MGSVLIDAIIKEDYCADFILEKMMGNMLMPEGTTEAEEMEMYLQSHHLNYFIPSGDGFLCIQFVGNFAIIPFAWHIGKRSTLKEMVRLGKQLYEYYTLELGMPIYYTGKKNLYAHNSVEIAENVWQFTPNKKL